jgi:hypothetical protein
MCRNRGFWFVVTASLASACAAAAPETDALIGRTISGHSFDGWTVETSHSWCVSSGEFNDQCSMVQLRKGTTMVVALTRPIERTPLGGIGTETIYRVFSVELPVDAELANCRDVEGEAAVLGWLNRRTKTATIFTIDGVSLKRTDLEYGSEEPCEIGQD